METKECNQCHKILPVTSEYFPRDSRIRSGFRGECKKCHNQYNREYKRKYRKKYKKETISMTNLHAWIKRRKEVPDKCVMCNKDTSKLQLANLSNEYYKDIRDFIWVCKRCHLLLDNIYKKARRKE